jgi:hypothetical protein
MKILYLSDNYAANVSGTKTSLFEEMQKRNFELVWKDVHSAGINRTDGSNLLRTLQAGKFTDLWVSHTWTELVGCTLQNINEIGVQVLGFGFSDPYEWHPEKLKQYNYYATNHLDTYNTLKKLMPTHYFPTACNVSFHKKLGLPKGLDILVFGQGEHPRFSPPSYRITMMKGLLDTYPNRIKIFGRGWHGVPHAAEIEGTEFLSQINRAKISIDLQQPHAPLAHRMFECMACGTLMITRDRPEVRKILELTTEALYYTDLASLKLKIDNLLLNSDSRERLATVMYNKIRSLHDISNRATHLIEFLKETKRL